MNMLPINHDSVTCEYIRSILDYDQETGMFKWKFRNDRSSAWNNRWARKIAGSKKSKDNYMRILINYKEYSAHRLAWLYVHGVWPNNLIDHINRNGCDNRICNLRKATYQQNNQNRTIHKTNKCGYKGVCFHKKSKKWRPTVYLNKKQIWLGSYDTLEEAAYWYAYAASFYYGKYRASA